MQESEEWSGLVLRAFDAININHSGRLGVTELEALLCDPDEGCSAEDTIPAALRTAEAEVHAAEASDAEDERVAGVNGYGRAVAAASVEGPVDRTGITYTGITSGGSDRSTVDPPSMPEDGEEFVYTTIDLHAFERLLRTTKADRLELFESRRVQRNGQQPGADGEAQAGAGNGHGDSSNGSGNGSSGTGYAAAQEGTLVGQA